MRDKGKPRVVISACLLGEAVRYDGTDRRHPPALEILGPHVDWIPLCPEVGLGLGVPRETVQLEGDPRAPRMRSTRTRLDHTEAMLHWVRGALDGLEPGPVHGFVLKRNSPSCGPEGVPVHPVAEGRDGTLRITGPPESAGSGLFAGQARLRYPDAPMTDEVGIADPATARAFLQEVLAHWDRSARAGGSEPQND